MKSINLYFIFYILLIISLISCNDTTTNAPVNDDILRTDMYGYILGGDFSDWCIDHVQDFAFGPAYPNPSPDSFTVSLEFSSHDTLFLPDTVSLYLINNYIDTIFFLENKIFFPGLYHIKVIIPDSLGFHNVQRRLFLKSKNYEPGDSCKNYGDIYFL
jgi:hypothetical protein